MISKLVLVREDRNDNVNEWYMMYGVVRPEEETGELIRRS
jgi:hypothetical protein